MGGTREGDSDRRPRLSAYKLGYVRHIVQAQILILTIYAITAYSIPVRILWAVDPLLSLPAAIAAQVLPLRFIVIATGMLIGAMVLGRAYCGWICPLGFIQDLVSKALAVPGRLGRGMRAYGEYTWKPPHLMVSRGRDVIGHVIWNEKHVGGFFRMREDRAALDGLLGGRADYVEVREIRVLQKYRGQGLEGKMLCFFEDFIRSRGYGSIVLHGDAILEPSRLLDRGYQIGSLPRGRAIYHRTLRSEFRIPEAGRLLKYAILLGGLILPLAAGWTFLEWITPMSIVPRALVPIWGPKEGVVLAVSIFLVVVALVATTERRAWCRYVCPLGAVLSLASVRKVVGIRLNRKRCIKCLRCERSCTMGVIDVEGQSGLRWDSECIACLACRDACPTDAIGLSVQV